MRTLHDSDISVPGYRQSQSEATLVAREYATPERFPHGRLARAGWVRVDGAGAEEILLAAVAEVGPARVLQVGPPRATVAAPELVCVEAPSEKLPFAAHSFDVVVCSDVLADVADVDGVLAELVRVLRPGGRFVGIYDTPAHLRELVGETQATFDSESGLAFLQARFAGVARRYCRGAVLWLTQRDLQTALDVYGPMRAPDGPYPFTATTDTCVFVADAP